MVNLFVNEKDLINIKVFIGVDMERQVPIANVDKEELIKTEGVKEDTIAEFNIKFKKPSYKTQTDIASKSFIVDHIQNTAKYDAAKSRYEMFRTLIKDWDFTDENGEKVEVTDEAIEQLHPNIATVIVSALEEKIT
jgi:hypothetical protein